MENNSLKLSWSMTLADYHKYFQNNEQYRKFCGACYQWSKSDPTSQAGYIHLAFSILLLENLSTTSEIWTLYSKDVMASKNATGKVNTGAIYQGMNGVFDLPEEKRGKNYQPWYNLLKELDASKTTIREAYKKIVKGLYKDAQNFKDPKKVATALEKVLDKLLTPTDTDIIKDRIQNGGCRQIILTGAPGTGKTTIARMIAESLGSPLDGEKYTLVQFHPSYDYTDFVEGLRPVAQSDQKESKIQFAKMDGSFKAFCRKVAEANGNTPKSHGTLEKVKYDLKAFAETDTFMANICPISNLISYLDSSDTDKISAFKTAFDKIEIDRFINSTPSFPTDSLNNAANTLKTCIGTLRNIVESGYIAPLFGLSAFLKNAAIQKLYDESQRNHLSDGEKAEAYDACYALRDALTGSKQTPITSASASSVFGLKNNELFEIVKYNSKKSIFAQNPVSTDTAKINWVNTNQHNTDPQKITIPKLFKLVSDVYPITNQVTRALETLNSWTYQTYQDEQISTICNAMKALSDPRRPSTTDTPLYFFIIDEINRANLSKVFGELMYGLEKDKRDTGFQTQYHNLPTCDNTGEKMANDIFDPNFYIPGNVIIIGTMNDIDRSVDSMDYALRRRFEWKEIVVNERSLSAAFTSGKYIQAVQDNQGNLVRCIMALNHYIQEKGDPYNLNRQYFISQGQFAHLPENLKTLDNLDEFDEKAELEENAASAELGELKKVLSYTWKYRIEPLLREYLRGESETDIQKFIDGAHGTLKDTLKSIKNDILKSKTSKSEETA